MEQCFRLNRAFLHDFGKIVPAFGFNGLGEIVYRRTYSRIKQDGFCENWGDTVERVVNGAFSIQKAYAHRPVPCLQEEAQKMYEKIFSFKFLPPGRGLWAMGTPAVNDKKLYAALNNCAFVSTEDIPSEPSRPFVFLMEASMLGVGVGFDTKGAGKITVAPPTGEQELYRIPDTREGWVRSVQLLLNSYFLTGQGQVTFEYSQIRPVGEPLKSFGGKSAGPQPLIALHCQLRELLNKQVGGRLTARGIIDLMNVIGKCVVAGNLRRSAEIAFGEPNDNEFLQLKNYQKHPERAEFGWVSNNSVLAALGMDYGDIVESIRHNGEPGLA